MGLTTLELTAIKNAAKTQIYDNFLYIALGTGTTAFSPSQTALVAETIRAARLTATNGTSNVAISGFVSSGTGNGTTLAEVGAFDSVSVGQMQTRTVFATAVVKTSDKELYIDYVITPTVTQA